MLTLDTNSGHVCSSGYHAHTVPRQTQQWWTRRWGIQVDLTREEVSEGEDEQLAQIFCRN